MFTLDLLGGCGISMEGGLDRLGRIPGVELGPGVESPLGVGVLDLSPGVPALSRCHAKRETSEIHKKYVTTEVCICHQLIHQASLFNYMLKQPKNFLYYSSLPLPSLWT